VANSLSELEAATANGDGITVVRTRGVESATHEILAWAVQNAMMTMQVAKGQCVGCAVKLGPLR
jgi:hypothetical protein